MRDVSFKSTTLRTARAEATLYAEPATLDAIRRGDTPKGDPLPIAKISATIAAKKTTDWIPYCHNIPIEHVDTTFKFEPDRIIVEVSVTSISKTGVEMEALTAAAAAVLNLYDMLKAIDETMEIGTIRLLEKRGGKSDFEPISGWTAAVLTVSDRASAGAYADVSGPTLIEGLGRHGAGSVMKAIVADDLSMIRSQVESWINQSIEVIVVTGGSGVGPRDVTPEAVAPLIEKPLPGVTQTLIRYGQDRMRTAMLSRSIAGIAGQSLVLAIPGSPSACEDALNALFPGLLHVIDAMRDTGRA